MSFAGRKSDFGVLARTKIMVLGGGGGHAPHICRCQNQLVVAMMVVYKQKQRVGISNCATKSSASSTACT